MSFSEGIQSGDIWREDMLVISACRQLAVQERLGWVEPRNPSSTGCLQAFSLGRPGDTCSLILSCPEGEGGQMLVAPSVNVSLYARHGDAVSRSDRIACS